MKVNAIIPARYQSERLPGKPLLKVKGKTIIEMVYERTRQSSLIDEVIVATDDQRIFETVNQFGGNAVLTEGDYQSGTDRIASVAEKLDCDIVVNVQGDEPLINPKAIDAAIQPFFDNSQLIMTTLKTPITDQREVFNPNVVKVVCDKRDFAIYFSRNPIPFKKTPQMALYFGVNEREIENYFKHVGLYCYKRTFLIELSRMAQTSLELMEGLEQLRVLENGEKIYVVESDYSAIGIDTHEDYMNLKEFLGDTDD